MWSLSARRTNQDRPAKDIASAGAEPAALSGAAIVARAGKLVAQAAHDRSAGEGNPHHALATAQDQDLRVRQRRRSAPLADARQDSARFSGLLARLRGAHRAAVTEAKKGKPAEKFWDGLTFSRVGRMGRGVRSGLGMPRRRRSRRTGRALRESHEAQAARVALPHSLTRSRRQTYRSRGSRVPSRDAPKQSEGHDLPFGIGFLCWSGAALAAGAKAGVVVEVDGADAPAVSGEMVQALPDNVRGTRAWRSHPGPTSQGIRGSLVEVLATTKTRKQTLASIHKALTESNAAGILAAQSKRGKDRRTRCSGDPDLRPPGSRARDRRGRRNRQGREAHPGTRSTARGNATRRDPNTRPRHAAGHADAYDEQAHRHGSNGK